MIASKGIQILNGAIWKPVNKDVDTSTILNGPTEDGQKCFSDETNTELWSAFADRDGDNGDLIHTLNAKSAKRGLGFAFQIRY